MAKVAFDDEPITVAATAIGVTAATAKLGETDAATRAVFTVETAQIRYRYDGTAATASVGHIAEAGEAFVIEGTGNIDNLSMIRTGATSATVHATYEH